MFAIGAATQIFLATGVTDLRKGCNGLFALVRARWERDALGGDLDLFCNRRRDGLKIFFWSQGAMWVVRRAFGAGDLSVAGGGRVGGHDERLGVASAPERDRFGGIETAGEMAKKSVINRSLATI